MLDAAAPSAGIDQTTGALYLGGEMGFRESFDVLRRHKGLTATLLLLTVAGTAGASVAAPSTYKASATEVLINSQQSSKALGDGNPYLSFDSSLVQMANILALKLTDPQNALALKQQGDTGSFTAQVLSENSQNEEPFIQISVSGASKSVVTQTLQGAIASLSKTLATLQTGVQAQDQASLQMITEDSSPTHSTSSRLKALVAVFAIGLVLTFLIPQAVDGAASRRRSRSDLDSQWNDQSQSRDPQLREGGDPDRHRYRRPATAREQSFQQRQWADNALEDAPSGQFVPPDRQEGRGPVRPEYGPPAPDPPRYSEPQRRW